MPNLKHDQYVPFFFTDCICTKTLSSVVNRQVAQVLSHKDTQYSWQYSDCYLSRVCDRPARHIPALAWQDLCCSLIDSIAPHDSQDTLRDHKEAAGHVVYDVNSHCFASSWLGMGWWSTHWFVSGLIAEAKGSGAARRSNWPILWDSGNGAPGRDKMG